jgi:hypothetical protein
LSSALAIVLIALAAVLVIFFVGGLLGVRRRDRAQAPSYGRHLAEADRALEQARAADRGWDRAVMEAAARKGLEEHYPGVAFPRLELVLVDDRPGIREDRAHFDAVDGERRVRVVVSRRESGWATERVG